MREKDELAEQLKEEKERSKIVLEKVQNEKLLVENELAGTKTHLTDVENKLQKSIIVANDDRNMADMEKKVKHFMQEKYRILNSEWFNK
jgi:hypothetical protein